MMGKQDAIHFSDGEKALCGSADRAITDKQKVTCDECLKLIKKQAKEDDDPIVKVIIHARDLDDGVDWPFTFRRPSKVSKDGKKVLKRYPLVNYRLISGAKHELPLSVVEHLENNAYPIKAYKENAPEGKSMVVTGMRHRFSISRTGV